MEYFFFPADEDEFKKQAKGKFVRTIIFNTTKPRKKTEIKNENDRDVVNSFCRKVSKNWKNPRKTNIEAYIRRKDIEVFRKLQRSKDNYQIYSWVADNDCDFGLPSFIRQD